jgi:hypothetical protein
MLILRVKLQFHSKRSLDESSRMSAHSALGIFMMTVAFSLNTFFIKFTRQNVRVGFPAKILDWRDIVKVRLVKIGSISFFDTLVLSTRHTQVSIPLSVFREPEAVLSEVRSRLSWAHDLKSTKGPILISKGLRITIQGKCHITRHSKELVPERNVMC